MTETTEQHDALLHADEGIDLLESSFILRADDSVLSRQYGKVEHALIFPGDTIVMPPQLDKRARLRDLLNVANIAGLFGLGAAAINVLK
jgi:hypothetical protein